MGFGLMTDFDILESGIAFASKHSCVSTSLGAKLWYLEFTSRKNKEIFFFVNNYLYIRKVV